MRIKMRRIGWLGIDEQGEPVIYRDQLIASEVPVQVTAEFWADIIYWFEEGDDDA